MQIIRINSKGTITAFIAIIAIAAMAFSINSANSSTLENSAFLKMQAARENALKTEEVIRMLDKATADGYYAGMNFSDCTSAVTNGDDYYGIGAGTGVIDNVATNYFSCDITGINPSIQGSTNIIEGTLACTTTVQGSTITDTVNFLFKKQPGGAAPDCWVKDSVTNDQQYP